MVRYVKRLPHLVVSKLGFSSGARCLKNLISPLETWSTLLNNKLFAHANVDPRMAVLDRMPLPFVLIDRLALNAFVADWASPLKAKRLESGFARGTDANFFRGCGNRRSGGWGATKTRLSCFSRSAICSLRLAAWRNCWTDSLIKLIRRHIKSFSLGNIVTAISFDLGTFCLIVKQSPKTVAGHQKFKRFILLTYLPHYKRETNSHHFCSTITIFWKNLSTAFFTLL
jgi:hypothetical protein